MGTLPHRNQLYISQQGPGENVLTSSDAILGYQRKWNICKDYFAKKNHKMFHLLLGPESKEKDQQVSNPIENSFSFWPHPLACGILVPRPGIGPGPQQ